MNDQRFTQYEAGLYNNIDAFGWILPALGQVKAEVLVMSGEESDAMELMAELHGLAKV